MGENVTADAQFGMATLLRPYENFNADYQGESPMRPILFTELAVPGAIGGWGSPLDPLAGQPGYSGNFVRGLKVPLGARLVLWLPAGKELYYQYTDPTDTYLRGYNWVIFWRLRTAYCYRKNRTPYHLPFQHTAAFNSGGDFIPTVVAGHSVPYAQNEQAKEWQQTRLHVYDALGADNIETVHGAIQNTNVLNPLVPGGGDAHVTNGGPSTASYISHEIQALGDEMIIGIIRTDVTVPAVAQATWAFNAGETDNRLYSRLVARERLGVRVMVGTAP